jgi:hypothetical protein
MALIVRERRGGRGRSFISCKLVDKSLKAEALCLNRLRRQTVGPLWFRKRETGMPCPQFGRDGSTFLHPIEMWFNMLDSEHLRRDLLGMGLDFYRGHARHDVHIRLHVTKKGKTDPVLTWFDKEFLNLMQ